MKGINIKREKNGAVNANTGKRASIVILIVVLVVIAFLLMINFITDWMWFREMGYTSVFLTKLTTQLKAGVPVFVILSLLMIIYMNMLRKSYFRKIVSHEITNAKRLNFITVGISVVFAGVVSGYFVKELWFEFLEFVNGKDFNIKDPLFGLDVSFYIFRLDFLSRLDTMMIGFVVLFFVVTLIYYTVLLIVHSPDVFEEDEAVPLGESENRTFSLKSRRISRSNIYQLFQIASVQLSIMGIVFFLMLGAYFMLAQFDLLHAHTGVVYGAGFTDVHVTLWVYRLLMLLSLVGALLVIPAVRKRSVKRIAAIPAVMIAVYVLGIGAAALVQNVIVAPDEISKESEYLANNIEYTQYAYDIDDVESVDFAAESNLTAGDIIRNEPTVSNIRINDYDPVKTFYNQTQSIRQYYKFNDTDVDRYLLDDDYTQTYLSVREIDEGKINNTWINRHLKYTHGYGAAVSRVDTITSSGQPDLIVRDIPPASSEKELEISRPQIYFGELSNDYVIVGTKEDEFDYPNGQENKYTRYEGDAGIRLSLLNRLMFSIREGSLKLLVSSNITGDSKIIINRNVGKRVKEIMPYLSYENDPYGVIADGRIYWIIDAYTTSSYYPYSEPHSGRTGTTNYIRNSIKVVVDAYNGGVSYYIVDGDDPIAKTYQSIFPKLFKDYDEMPEVLRSHIRYPNTMLEIQADVYGQYHMSDANVFYQNEDAWEVSHEIYGTEERKLVPNYFVLQLPGESEPEFVSMLPYSPKSKQNMTALLMTRNDGDHYGQLVLYRFPKNRTVYGPMQIEAQIDQNTKISQDFSLWSQAGSKYSRGTLFVVPMDDSLMYIEPIYLEAANSAIPEVKKVVVAYGDRIAYENTLQEALVSLFGDEISGGIPGGSGNDGETDGNTGNAGTDGGVQVNSEYAKAAQDAYNNAQQALKNGDWALYGKYMDELEENLNKLVGSKN